MSIRGSSTRSNTLSWPVIEVNMVRISSVRFIKNGVIRGMGWRAAFSTANRDCRQGKGLLDPWREWLKEQRESGNYNASRIWREMVARGFTGSETIVRDAVAKWRKGWNPPVTTAVRLPSVSRVSRWLMPRRIIRGEENYASRFISLMCEKNLS